MTDHHGPLPVPARITLALDAIAAEGPWVDEALGGEEPMVDQWEAGELLPTRQQIELLAQLTNRPAEYFYLPADDIAEARIFVCDRTRRGENGLAIFRSHVDWAGVLHVEEETPPRPPRKTRKRAGAATAPVKARDGRHEANEDPQMPGYCTCGLPVEGSRKHWPA